MRKRTLSLFLGALTLVAAFVVRAHLQRNTANANRQTCRSNLAKLSQSLRLYARDFDGHFPSQRGAKWVKPDAKNRPIARRGWLASLASFLPDEQCLKCPSNLTELKWPRHATDYWFNARLLGQETSNVVRPNQTFLLGEGGAPDGADAAYVRSSLSNWLGHHSMPVYRHELSAHYLFVDGHIALIAPEAAHNFAGRNDPFSPE